MIVKATEMPSHVYFWSPTLSPCLHMGKSYFGTISPNNRLITDTKNLDMFFKLSYFEIVERVE